MMKKATAVLDFGTSKVLVLLAEESAYQKVTITSAGMAQYDGFMNGEWNAPSEVSDAIASAIEAAEKKVGTHIKEVYVGVPGEFVRVYVIESSVALQGADPKVTSADVEKLQRQATEMLDRPTGVIIHRSPAWFKVDGGQKTLEPVDQKGLDVGRHDRLCAGGSVLHQRRDRTAQGTGRRGARVLLHVGRRSDADDSV